MDEESQQDNQLTGKRKKVMTHFDNEKRPTIELTIHRRRLIGITSAEDELDDQHRIPAA